MSIEKNKIKGIIESALFLNGDAISIQELCKITELEKDELITVISEMMEEKENEASGLKIIKIRESYQMIVKEDFYEVLSTYFDNRRPYSLSNAAMETLSIIAYNENITRNHIESIRGVNSDGIVNRLLAYELIEEAGKSELPGRPMSYKVSDKFYLTFGIENESNLPPLPKIDIEDEEEIESIDSKDSVDKPEDKPEDKSEENTR